MLTELVEFGHKLDEKVKAMLRETKENVQGTNSDRKETGTQINSLNQKEKINIRPEQNEESRIQKKMKRGLGTSRTTLMLQHLNHRGARRRRGRARNGILI